MSMEKHQIRHRNARSAMVTRRIRMDVLVKSVTAPENGNNKVGDERLKRTV
jgi:hypothetical protein